MALSSFSSISTSSVDCYYPDSTTRTDDETDLVNKTEIRKICGSNPVIHRKNYKKKVLMGKGALDDSDQLKHKQSKVVHQLVTNKYENQLTDCINRIYCRRQLRDSTKCNGDYFIDDDSSSNYSADSLLTINTPDSLYDGRSYFSLLFPIGKTNNDIKNVDDDFKNKLSLNENPSLNSTVLSNEMEYDPKNFLENALGDNIDLLEQQPATENSFLNNSESVNTSNISTILSKTGSFYNTMKTTLRKAYSFKAKNNKYENNNNDYIHDSAMSLNDDESNEQHLWKELYIQNGTIFQALKALSYCKLSGDIWTSECLEAERILLTATCSKEAIQASIDQTDKEQQIVLDPYYDKYSGALEIFNLTFYLKKDISNDENHITNQLLEYFVVIVTSGPTVLSSKVTTANRNTGEVKINKIFRLTGLKKDFAISVAIYVLRGPINKEDDTNKKDRNLKSCPSPKNFFHLPYKSPRKNASPNILLKSSSFTLWGKSTLHISDGQKSHIPMQNVPLCSSLENYFTASLKGSVEITLKKSNFLTIGTEEKTHFNWNRRWCVLDGNILNYWNYPMEEYSTNPIGRIALNDALEQVFTADRNICPRPKTLCLLVKNEKSPYFLTSDSLDEKREWQDAINFVINTLSCWKLFDIQNP